jgi:hypothetical protein
VFTQGTNRVDTGFIMAEVLNDYIARLTPVTQGTEGRITRVQAYYPFLARDSAMTATPVTSTVVLR